MLRRALRLLLIACAAPLLCSCRAPMHSAPTGGARSVAADVFGFRARSSRADTHRRPRARGEGVRDPSPLLASASHQPEKEGAVVQVSAELPDEAYTGHSGDGFTQPGAMPGHMRDAAFVPPTRIGPPLPRMVYGPWAPPGFKVPWPEQEYLRDGGDKDGRVVVRDDWRRGSRPFAVSITCSRASSRPRLAVTRSLWR
jgi:hypothetical protein